MIHGSFAPGQEGTTKPHGYAFAGDAAAIPFESLAAAALLLTMVAVPPHTHQLNTRPTAYALAVHVAGSHLVDGTGATLVLRGVNRSGSEYQCVHGQGIFDGPSDLASVRAIASWHANVMRVPLNEDCWLDINGASPGGAAYRSAIVNFVNLLNSQGLYAILELHWSAPGEQLASGQQPMPDQDHSPAFWQSVASTFGGNPAVVFDLYNEPYPDGNADTTAAWTCWRDGGSCPRIGFTVAGVQELVNTVRSTGAQNVIMLGGIQYANSLSQWLAYRPSDSAAQLAASDHNYAFNICITQSCWVAQMGTVAQHNPVMIGETGDSTCGSISYVNRLLPWADSQGISYLGWTWDTWGARNDDVLIQDYSGSPTVRYGQYFRDHLLAVAGQPAPGPPPTGLLGRGASLAVVRYPSGPFSLFARGADGHVDSASQVANGTWTPFVDLGCTGL